MTWGFYFIFFYWKIIYNNGGQKFSRNSKIFATLLIIFRQIHDGKEGDLPLFGVNTRRVDNLLSAECASAGSFRQDGREVLSRDCGGDSFSHCYSTRGESGGFPTGNYFSRKSRLRRRLLARNVREIGFPGVREKKKEKKRTNDESHAITTR